MNEHEAARIAAAVHELRPDWPASSVLTLIKKHLLDKPRRDVSVAFAWVACEAATANPARVLELGPWWKAAGIEGGATRREVLNPAERCGVCSERQDRCRAVWGADHTFEPDFKSKRGADVIEIVTAVKAEVAPMRDPKTTTRVTTGAGRVRLSAEESADE